MGAGEGWMLGKEWEVGVGRESGVDWEGNGVKLGGSERVGARREWAVGAGRGVGGV